MATPCLSCPFAGTLEAEVASNSGCLPTAGDIVRLKRGSGHNWACHANCNRVCQGLVAHNEAQELGLDMSQGQLVHEFESAHSRAQWRGAADASLDYELLRHHTRFSLSEALADPHYYDAYFRRPAAL